MILDGSDVDALARRLLAARVKLIPALVPVAHKAGNRMKSGLRRQAAGHRGMPGLVGGITYEIETTSNSVTVAAGWFNPVGQQHLENIAAFGTSDTPAVMDITQPLRDEVPQFMKWAARVAAEVTL